MDASANTQDYIQNITSSSPIAFNGGASGLVPINFWQEQIGVTSSGSMFVGFGVIKADGITDGAGLACGGCTVGDAFGLYIPTAGAPEPSTPGVVGMAIAGTWLRRRR
jgi:hypothetical protein